MDAIIERPFKDSDGNECTLEQMIKREPEWVASRWRADHTRLASLEAFAEAVERAKRTAWSSVYDDADDDADSDILAVLLGDLDTATAALAKLEGKE